MEGRNARNGRAVRPIKYKYAVTFMEVELNSHTVLLP